jgi:hypothetical protein
VAGKKLPARNTCHYSRLMFPRCQNDEEGRTAFCTG